MQGEIKTKKEKVVKQLEGPELFFGLVGAVGTDLDLVCSTLENSLVDVGYKTEVIHVIELLHDIDKWKNIEESPLDVRIDKHMTAGDDFRGIIERGDALSMLAIGRIRKIRGEVNKSYDKVIPRHAYILRSLKNPCEVESLRKIYGSGFILIAAYSPREDRLHNLARKIAHSHNSSRIADYLHNAHILNKRDEEEQYNEFGQNVRNTYPLADVFINARNVEELKVSMKRFIELFFGYPFHTPTREEYGMFHAQAAALRSADLSRQVGAVIATKDGNIIGVGTNEVPKPGGGLYWSGDTPDYRDFLLGYQTSEEMKKNTLGEVLDRLVEKNWINKEKLKKVKDDKKDLNNLVKKILPLMKGTQLMNIGEFGRSVHAEMAAIVDAACRGVPVHECTLYSTTFPCHECARHIVAAGIRTVFYIEPYPKSLAKELHLDSISVDSSIQNPNQVNFFPFVGIAPRQYMNLFSMVERKDEDGKVVFWDRTKSMPKFYGSEASYIRNEKVELDALYEQLENKGLKPI